MTVIFQRIFLAAIFLFVSLLLLLYKKPTIKFSINTQSSEKNAKISQINISQKYLLFDNGFSGWADRYKGIMSAYALALFTNRTFLIRITNPCNLNEYLIPNKINWNQNISYLISTGRLNKNYSKVFLDYIHLKRYEFVKKLISFDYYNHIDVISFQSIVNSLGIYLRQLFPVEMQRFGFIRGALNQNNLFSKWSMDMFKLSSKIQKKFDFYKQKLKPANNVTVLCAQIRTNDFEQFRSYKYLGRYWDHIKNNFIRLSPDYRLFITSNDEKVIKFALEVFPKDRVIFTNGTAFHFSQVRRKEDCYLWEKIILDFNLLSLCEKAVYGNGGFGIEALLNAKSLKEKQQIKDDYYETIEKYHEEKVYARENSTKKKLN